MTRRFPAALALAFPLTFVAGVDAQRAVSERPQPTDSAARRLEKLRQDERGPSPPTSQESAQRLEGIARENLREGDRGRAIELLSEAARRDPQSGEVFARLTLAYLANRDFEFARATLDAAAGRSDLRATAPELFAEVAEQFAGANRLDDAVAAWELSERFGGNDPAIRARLERARRELSVTLGQRLLQGERFAIYADAAISESVVAAAEAHLEREYLRQRELFGPGELPGPQVVILYAGRRFFSLVSVPDWVSGVFDGKIRISLDPGAGFTPETASVLSHELAHAWIRFLSKDRAAGWLHEGLAQWCEGRRLPRKDFRRVFEGQPVSSLAELETRFARRADRVAVRANYVEALGIVEYIAFSRGEGALACLVRDLGEGIDPEEALRRETGLTRTELVSRWKSWAGI